MNITFIDLISSLDNEKRFNEDLYNLIELGERLEMANSINISTGDHYLLLPFYICDGGIYELYWSGITIQSVDAPSLVEHILTITSKDDIEMVDKEIKERMENLYLEVVMPKTTFPALALIHCIKYIINSKEVIEDVSVVFTRDDMQFKFDSRCLYFAVY